MASKIPSEGLTGIPALDSRPIWDGGRDFGLDSPTKLLAALGNPQNKTPAVHVGGTNGKGSVCAFIAGILLASDYSVGQFTSPHLSSVTERCVINGRAVEFNDFAAVVESVVATADSNCLDPSFFELVSASCFVEFSKRDLDWMVIEVGLGGRLDATNTIAKAKASVVVNVQHDHMHILGDSLDDIAKEKAGIFRSEVPVFLGRVAESPKIVMERRAREIGAPVYVHGDEFGIDEHGEFFIEFGRQTMGMLPQLPLVGSYQFDNAALAARVGLALGCSWKSICEGLCKTRWPGRLEFFPGNVSTSDVLFDVAHNVDAVALVSLYLEGYCMDHKVESLALVVSILGRKDWPAMLTLLKETLIRIEKDTGANVQVVFTTSGHKSAVPPEDLQHVFGAGIVVAVADDALNKAMECAGSSGLVAILGSAYLVGALRPRIAGERAFTTYSSDL